MSCSVFIAVLTYSASLNGFLLREDSFFCILVRFLVVLFSEFMIGAFAADGKFGLAKASLTVFSSAARPSWEWE